MTKKATLVTLTAIVLVAAILLTWHLATDATASREPSRPAVWTATIMEKLGIQTRCMAEKLVLFNDWLGTVDGVPNTAELARAASATSPATTLDAQRASGDRPN